MESARRASGAAITANLHALSKPASEERKLRTLAARGAQPAKRGRADWKGTAQTAGGGGIAGPLEEQNYSEREYHAEGLKSSDGLFVIPAIKKMTLTDANGDPVIVMLAPPVTPVPVP